MIRAQSFIQIKFQDHLSPPPAPHCWPNKTACRLHVLIKDINQHFFNWHLIISICVVVASRSVLSTIHIISLVLASMALIPSHAWTGWKVEWLTSSSPRPPQRSLEVGFVLFSPILWRRSSEQLGMELEICQSMSGLLADIVCLASAQPHTYWWCFLWWNRSINILAPS